MIFFQGQWTVKYRSTALSQGACLKGMSNTITKQGFMISAFRDAEKRQLLCKNWQS